MAHEVAEHINEAGHAVEHVAGGAAEHAEHVAHEVAHHVTEPDLMTLVLDSNLINFLVVAIALAWVLNKFLPKLAKENKAKLIEELQEAREARKEAEAKLEDFTQRIAQSEEETKNMVLEAEKTAQQIKEQAAKDTEEHIVRMKDLAEKDILRRQNQAIQAIKEMATNAAISLTEESVRQAAKDETVLRKIQDKFVTGLNSVR